MKRQWIPTEVRPLPFQPATLSPAAIALNRFGLGARPDEAAPAATAEDEGDGEMAALGVELTVMAPDAVGTRLIEAATASADWLARRRLPVAVMGAAGAVVAEPMPAAAATERGSSDD